MGPELDALGELRLKDIRHERLRDCGDVWLASLDFDVMIRKLPQTIGRQHLEVSWGHDEKVHEWSHLVDGAASRGNAMWKTLAGCFDPRFA